MVSRGRCFLMSFFKDFVQFILPFDGIISFLIMSDCGNSTITRNKWGTKFEFRNFIHMIYIKNWSRLISVSITTVTLVYRATLCFCTGSCAASGAAAGRRFLLTPQLLNNFFDFFDFWQDCWPWPRDYLIRFSSIFVVTLTLNCQGQI